MDDEWNAQTGQQARHPRQILHSDPKQHSSFRLLKTGFWPALLALYQVLALLRNCSSCYLSNNRPVINDITVMLGSPHTASA
jgi:hypothetical protein